MYGYFLQDRPVEVVPLFKIHCQSLCSLYIPVMSCKNIFSEIGDILGKIQKMAENATKNTQSSSSTPPKQIGFTETFKRELREGFKELEKKTKKQ